MDYMTRLVDADLDELMPALAAIAIEGVKGVGKTETAQRRASSVLALDSARLGSTIAAEPELVLRADPPILIDEWQRVPQIWDVIRRQVDRNPAPGQFLLTGSASASGEVPIHSGAGRIVRLRMRPMALCERGLPPTTVSLGDLLGGGSFRLEGTAALSLPDYAEEIVASGLPGLRRLPGRARTVQLDSYLERLLDREFADLGVRVRRPRALRAWLASYAAATATTASYNVILDAATAGETDKPARQTTAAYRETLERLWVLDPLAAWLPSMSPLKRLAQAPKHHLADPALAARLLGATQESLLRGVGETLGPAVGTLLGALFESLCVLTVRAIAQSLDATVSHLRTRNGDHEIDLIVERRDGRVLAMEVKLSATVATSDVVHLNWLKSQIGDRLVGRVVITTGPYAYRRPDGVAVVPLALLGR